MANNVEWDTHQTPLYLGAALLSFSQALGTALESLAEVHGTDDLTWFDNLRDKVVQEVKGNVTENVDVQLEAQVLRFSIEAVDAKFKSMRASLAKT